MMVTIWPVVGRGCKAFDELRACGGLFEEPHWADGHVYDAFDENARQVWTKESIIYIYI